MRKIFKNFGNFFKEFFKNIQRIFKEYFPKGVKKQAYVACVIPFAPNPKKSSKNLKFWNENYTVNFKPILNTLEMDFQKGL